MRVYKGAFVLWIPQLGLFCLSCVPSKPSYVPVMRKNVKSLGVMGQGKVCYSLKALGLAALDPFRVLPGWDLETDAARDPEGYFEISVM